MLDHTVQSGSLPMTFCLVPHRTVSSVRTGTKSVCYAMCLEDLEKCLAYDRLFKNIFLEFIYFRERERENLKQEPGSKLSAQSLMWDLNPWTMRSWPELKSDAYLTEPPRRPRPSLFLREGETEHEWGRGRERGIHRIQKQAPGSELSAKSLTWGLNSWTVRSWPELKSDTKPTKQTPLEWTD